MQNSKFLQFQQNEVKPLFTNLDDQMLMGDELTPLVADQYLQNEQQYGHQTEIMPSDHPQLLMYNQCIP